MKITKYFLVALVPLSLGLQSCGDDTANAYELGREVEFPEMTAEERGTNNGVILAKALFSICDTVASAQKKELVSSSALTGEQNLSRTAIFNGMLTSPLSKTQRPYELSVEYANDSLWMRGFKTALDEELKLSEAKYTDLMKILAQINYADIDDSDNARRCLEINRLMK